MELVAPEESVLLAHGGHWNLLVGNNADANALSANSPR